MQKGNRPRICVDSRSLIGEGTGIATYTRGLIAAIEAGGQSPSLLKASGGSYRWLRVLRAALPGSIRLAERDGALTGWDIFRTAQVRFTLHGRITRLHAPGPPGVMHWPYPVPLMIEGWRNLYTVHDTIPLTHPHLTSIDRERHLQLLRAVSHVAARILTVSDTAAADIRAALDCPAGHVVNCSQAVIPEKAEAPLPAGCEPGRYFLFCGRLEDRKNVRRLIEAYRASGTTLPLLLAGPVVEGGAEILEIAARHPGIRHLAYLDRETLVSLMADARALLLPSLAEGFGLPMVEAMAMGTPTLVSQDPALLEVSGGASLVVDGEDIGDMASGIASLATDDTLCKDLAIKGIGRAKGFTLTAFRSRLAALYGNLSV